jgi:predicted nuclease of predicted toxin-antitoxin system
MKLLLDANLSRRSVAALQSIFPASIHCTDVLGSGPVPDEDIFKLARDNGFALVTKDKDFVSLSLRHGRPPLIIWIKLGNGSRQQTENLLRANRDILLSADENPAIAIVEIG